MKYRNNCQIVICQGDLQCVSAVTEVQRYEHSIIFFWEGDMFCVEVNSEQMSPESPAADRETLLS